MAIIPIKPLSVNEAWKGRRFRTDEYKKYARDCGLLLPPKVFIPEGKLQIVYEFYLSNEKADYDNPIKPIQDIICAKYGINDHRIYRAIIEKIIVPKSQEKTLFRFEEYYPNGNKMEFTLPEFNELVAQAEATKANLLKWSRIDACGKCSSLQVEIVSFSDKFCKCKCRDCGYKFELGEIL